MVLFILTTSFPLVSYCPAAALMRTGAGYVPAPVLQHRGRQRREASWRIAIPVEPRGGNEPPRPRRRSHGCGPVFCSSTRRICAHQLRLSHPYVRPVIPSWDTMSSFQRVSALRSSHLGCSVAMPLGRTPMADSVSTRSAGFPTFPPRCRAVVRRR